MNSDGKITFDLIVATTGEYFSVDDVPLSATVREVITAFCNFQHIVGKQEQIWKLALGGQIVDDNATLLEVFSKNENRTVQLIAKVSGA